MNKKSTYTTILLVLIAITLIAIAIFLLIDFTSAKKFSDLIPDAEQFDSCQITCVMVDRKDETTIAGDELKGLVSMLSQQQYHKRGSYDSTLEGTIYHLYFSSPQAETREMIISDLGKVYIGSNYYDFGPDVSPAVISSYIETILK